jgi:imidazolonepropionase
MGAPDPGQSFVLHGLRAAASPAGTEAPLRGSDLGRVDVQEPAAIAVVDGRIAAVGAPEDVLRDHGGLEAVDCRGAVAIPGLVDCHTHPAFGGDRAAEFDLRAQGADYERIHASGGGIRSTVEATRRLGAEGVRQVTAQHLGWMAANGTTTAEGKSGYGLDRDTELASLAAVAGPHEIATVPTYLGAHSVPPEFGSADEYLDFALAEVLPEAAAVADHADVFLERGAFSAEQADRYLRAAMDHGLVARLHGDQFTESGAIPLAVELGARSVDHLEATGDEGVRTLAASDVVGVLLPASALFLGRPMPPGRALVDAGAAIALATDFNPGSAFCESLPLCCSLAATQLKLSPAESLAACTVNAAHVLGRSDRLGRLAPGYRADIVLLDAPDWRYLAYHLGGDLVGRIVTSGELR